MIPVVILLALIAGLFRLHWVAIPAIAGLWVVFMLVGGDQTVPRPDLIIAGGLFGLANAGPGYGLGRGIRTMVTTVKHDVSEHLDATRDLAARSSQLEIPEGDPS